MSLVPYALGLAEEIIGRRLTYRNHGQWLGYAGGPNMGISFPADDQVRELGYEPEYPHNVEGHSEYDPHLPRNMVAWELGLDPAEVAALRAYTGPEGHLGFNFDMRGEKPLSARQLAALRAFDRAPYSPQPFPVYRGLQFEDPGEAEGFRELLRGAQKTGNPFRPRGFVSSTPDPFSAWAYSSTDLGTDPVFLEIMAQRGFYVPNYADPLEFLMAHETPFEVVSEKVLPVGAGRGNVMHVPSFQLRQLR